MCRKEITESHRRSVIKVLRHLQIDFHIRYNNLSTHQQCVRVFLSYLLQHFLSGLFTIVILIGEKQYLKVPLVCIFLMTRGVNPFKNSNWPGMFPFLETVLISLYHLFMDSFIFFLVLNFCNFFVNSRYQLLVIRTTCKDFEGFNGLYCSLLCRDF